MPHDNPLITTIVAALTLAFVFGLIANRLRISPLVGYLIAGIAIGPFTPGFVGDADLAQELAEIGVILLMFGVGLHFSFRELLSVKNIAVPGALVQIAVATLLGTALALYLGWGIGAGLVFGLALSVASTVVLLRTLQEHHLLNTDRGKIAVGWLIVEDLAMVLALVLLPAFAPMFTEGGQLAAGQIIIDLAITIAKVIAFAVLMLVIGRKLIPEILHYTAHTASRELFRLAVLVIALGVAFGAAVLFDVSFALGAFFAGMVLAESILSQRAAEETLPLRDAFAVLFFVSVGMLFNPMVLLRDFWALAATVFIIVIGKSLAAYGIVRLFRHPPLTALTISASLAQIGEFSFILAGLGVVLGLLPSEGRDLIMAGALISIVLNPLIFVSLPWAILTIAPPSAAVPAPSLQLAESVAASDKGRSPATGRAIIVGYGRVGSVVGEALREIGWKFTIIENNPDIVASLDEKSDVPFVDGNGVEIDSLRLAGVETAQWLIVTAPDAFEAGQIIERSRHLNPKLVIVARAHFDAEVEHLMRYGADQVIMGEREIAAAMVGWLMREFIDDRP
jgi:CPA2 family monovalent cation:H+ antiporter-2